MDEAKGGDDLTMASWLISTMRNFKKFLFDLVNYCLEAVGLQSVVVQNPEVKLLFKQYIGDTVLRYRNAHDEDFRVRIRASRPFEDIVGYVTRYMRSEFKRVTAGNVGSKLFTFCTFIVDVVIFCCRYHRDDLVIDAVNAAYSVYDYMSMYGRDVAWNSFLRVVDIMCNEFENPQGAKSSTSLVTSDELDEADEIVDHLKKIIAKKKSASNDGK